MIKSSSKRAPTGLRIARRLGELVGVVLWLASAPAAQAAGEINYAVQPAGAGLGMSFANYPTGSLDHGSIDRQVPVAVEAVETLSVTVSTLNDFDCGQGDAEHALAAPNQAKPEGTAVEPASCLFALRMTMVGRTLAREIVAGCTEWQDDVSYCWFEGDAGQFWVRRLDKTGSRLQLILGPFDESSAGAPRTGAVAEDGTYNGVPAHGILIEQGEPDLGEAASDLWLIWSRGLTTIDVAR